MGNRMGEIRRTGGLILIFLLFVFVTKAQTNLKFEAEDAVLSGTAEIVNCGNASGGNMVKGLDNGQANAVLFNKIKMILHGAKSFIVRPGGTTQIRVKAVGKQDLYVSCFNDQVFGQRPEKCLFIC